MSDVERQVVSLDGAGVSKPAMLAPSTTACPPRVVVFIMISSGPGE
ncbi:MAG TPA: hypothetical protein VN748_14565 [Pseudonocardiaceae bacterium]|jgi:hypothetical protein|nr:hypothetical protein [Pseudonocardiaceae bacterium]